MFRSVIPAALLAVMALTGCGGGGGGGNGQPAAGVETTWLVGSVNTSTSYQPSMVSGDFVGDGSQFVVVSGWLVGSNSPPPVKIYKLNDSQGVDVTTAILGSEFSWSVNYLQVADFNQDGIDDIFFPGFTDYTNNFYNSSVVFMSRRGSNHVRVLVDGLNWNHGSTVVDLDRDGWLDIIGSEGSMWINDQAGGFRYVAGYKATDGVAYPIGGSGLCSGDFDGSGTTQIVGTDQSGLAQSNYVYKLDSQLRPTLAAVLPMPYWETRTDLPLKSGMTNRSHDVACLVADFNGDGRQDIAVISYYNNNGDHSYVQIYFNQGNFVFEDVSSVAMMNYDTSQYASYNSKIVDFNNDGKPDLFLGRQLWINTGTGSFTKVKNTEINEIITKFSQVTGTDSNETDDVWPVRINGAWNLTLARIAALATGANQTYLGYVKTKWVF